MRKILTAIGLMTIVTSANSASLFSQDMLNSKVAPFKIAASCSVILEYHAGMAYFGMNEHLANGGELLDEEQLKDMATFYLVSAHMSKVYNAVAIANSNNKKVTEFEAALRDEVDAMKMPTSSEELAKLPLYKLAPDCAKRFEAAKSAISKEEVDSLLQEATNEVSSLLYGESPIQK